MVNKLKEVYSNKVRAHISYRNSQGTYVPGVTTVLGILDKPWLIAWANKLGLEGIDSTKYRNEKGSIGSLAHYMIMSHLKGETPDVSEYSELEKKYAKISLKSFWLWKREHSLAPILIEEGLVSDTYNYGGTIDLYCLLDGQYTLIDFKTGKSIYPEMFYQLAAYKELLLEHKYPFQQARLLRIGREGGFEDKRTVDLSREFEIFKHCLAIYNIRKLLQRF